MALRPAGLDIQGIGRLAVVEFQGQGETGRIATSVLQARLSENRHYALVDRAELSRVVPAAFTSGAPEEGAVLQAARQAGVDAVLTGQVVSYNVADRTEQDVNFSLGGGGTTSGSGLQSSGFGVGIDSSTLHERDAAVSLAFKLIDARTGQVREARQVTHTFEGRVVNREGDLPSSDRILNDLLQACARDIEALVAPHYETVEVTLARQYFGKGLSNVRRGNALAKQGDWAGATTAWEAAVKGNPGSHAALHNLALAAEARGDYAAAQGFLDRATRELAATLYHQTRSRIESGSQKHAAAMAQAAAKPALFAMPPANALPPEADVTPVGFSPLVPGTMEIK